MALSKKKNNKSYIMAVILMIALIFALMVPTTIAWFTDTEVAGANFSLNFGEVSVNTLEDQSSLISSERDVYNILPGDKLDINISVINDGSVPEYIMVGSHIKFLYLENEEKIDITKFMQPYITSVEALKPSDDFIIQNTDGMFLLNPSETAQLKGRINLSTALPNALGYFDEYILNGARSNVSIEITTLAASIQNFNITETKAQDQIKSLIFGKDIVVGSDVYSEVDLNTLAFLNSYNNENHPDAQLLALRDVSVVDNLTNVVIDASNLDVKENDKVSVLHYNEENYEWETVQTCNVESDKTITVTQLTSLSPIALVKEPENYEYNVTGAGEGAVLTANGKQINCVAAWDVSATKSDNVVVYIVTEGATTSLIVAGNGSMATYTNGTQPYIDYQNIVNEIVVKYGVTNVSNQAFRQFAEMTTLKLSNTVETIDVGAFIYSSKLKNIHFGTGLKSIGKQAFAASGMQKVTLPKNLELAGDQIFQQCTSLVKAIFLNDNTDCGQAVFYRCTNLKNVYLPQNLTELKLGFFQECSSLEYLKLPESLITIGIQAFNECTSLNMEVNLPNAKNFNYKSFYNTKITAVRIDSAEEIAAVAFDSCANLKTVYMPNVKYIHSEAFEGCTNLTIDLPEGLIWIGDNAFNHCEKSTQSKIVIPASVVQIGGAEYVGGNNQNNVVPAHLFYNSATASLKEYVVKEGNQYFVAHEGVLYTKDYKILIAYPPAKVSERYEIQEGCTILGENSISRAHFLKTLVLPNSYIITDENSVPDNFLNKGRGNSLSLALYVYNSIEKFEVKQDNPNYSCDNYGILYSKDYSKLIAIPTYCNKGGTITIHQNVSSIDLIFLMVSGSSVTVTYNGVTLGVKASEIVLGAKVQNVSENALAIINAYGWKITNNSPYFSVVDNQLQVK